MIHTRPAATLAMTVLVLSGCSALVEKTVPQADLEAGVQQMMEEQAGEPIESVACDGDLAAEVDAEIRCTIEATDGSTIGLTVTATDIDGDDIRYEVVVDDAATTPSPTTSPTGH